MTTRLMRSYRTLPAAPTRGPMPPCVSVILPIARTNIVTNPSIELATTGYTAVGGSIARSAAQQYHGVYSLAVTPGAGTTDGAYYATSLTSGQVYAFSCKVKGVLGVPYKISIATTGGADLAVFTFTGTGRWQWVAGYYLETSTTSRRFYFTKNGSTNTGVFYVDGVQIEAITAGESVSTYIDGDQVGLLVGQQPPAYLWTGTPHASTSTRSALTRAGGYVVNLSIYNFLLTGLIGLGMAAPNNISVPYTVLDGARYIRTTKPPRSFTLVGRWQSDDPVSQYLAASDMRQAFDRDLVALQQPLLLMVEPQDECEQVIGDFATVPCIYAGGLEGNDGNVPVEDIAPTFTMYAPFVLGGDAGAELSGQQPVTNANAIAQRSPTGVWSALGTGISGASASVFAMTYGLDGALYVGGDFLDAGGSGADYLAKWDGTSWSVVKSATSLNSTVFALATGPDGRIYIGGDFTNADGIAAADYIAVYNPTANTYAALGTGAGGIGVRALAFDTSGNLWAGGTFPSMGGVANTAAIARWNGSAWQSVGNVAGGLGDVYALAPIPAGGVYAAGDFTSINAVAALNVARYNGTVWSALSSGVNNTAIVAAVGPNNILYVGGVFTSAGGVSVAAIASWNGIGWSPLGSGIVTNVQATAIDASGTVYVGGTISTAGGIPTPDGGARWNGSSWQPLDIDLPGGPVVTAIKTSLAGAVTLGFSTSGTATTAATTTVTNSAPSIVYPRLTIKGPSSGTARIYQIVNTTTGIGIYLNYTINAGETAVFTFDPTNPSFVSDFQGDLTHTILPGSQIALFYLAPGANTISFLSASSTVTATLSWQRRYNGLADLVN